MFLCLRRQVQITFSICSPRRMLNQAVFTFFRLSLEVIAVDHEQVSFLEHNRLSKKLVSDWES